MRINFQMYSGYFMHEVKANLVDAEKMFEAMGYTLMPNHTLVLDGPICPDQVTNVSRDAMTAYAECQVHILTPFDCTVHHVFITQSQSIN